MSWIYLLLAGFMEILGVIAMKNFALSNKKIFLFAIGVLFMLSLGLLSLAMQSSSMGVAYAIWTGIGAGGGVIVGILFFKESAHYIKLTLVGVIIICSAGLKLLS